MITICAASDLESQWERALRPIVVLGVLATRQPGTLIELCKELEARGVTLDLDELDEIVTCLVQAGLIEHRRADPDGLPDRYLPTPAGAAFAQRQRMALSRLAGLADADEVAAQRAALASARRSSDSAPISSRRWHTSCGHR